MHIHNYWRKYNLTLNSRVYYSYYSDSRMQLVLPRMLLVLNKVQITQSFLMTVFVFRRWRIFYYNKLVMTDTMFKYLLTCSRYKHKHTMNMVEHTWMVSGVQFGMTGRGEGLERDGDQPFNNNTGAQRFNIRARQLFATFFFIFFPNICTFPSHLTICYSFPS